MRSDDHLLSLADRWAKVSREEEGSARSLQRIEENRDGSQDFKDLVQAEKDFAAAEEECSELRRQIAVLPARTLEGFLFKARVAAWSYSTDLDGIESILRTKIAGEFPYGPTAATICELIVLDLLRYDRSVRDEAEFLTVPVGD